MSWAIDENGVEYAEITKDEIEKTVRKMQALEAENEKLVHACEAKDKRIAELEEQLSSEANWHDLYEADNERLRAELDDFLTDFAKHPMDLCWDDPPVLKLRAAFDNTRSKHKNALEELDDEN